jgi:predicted PurR-regulated permease PerM
MISLGIFYAAGLWLVGLQLGILIGLLSGLAAIVPYLGFIVGIAAASLAVLFQFGDWLVPLLLVWLVYGAGQVLESVAFTPLFVGDRIGLHPVAVIFAVLAGGQLFGFVGVLLALPIAAVIVVLMRHAHAYVTG